MKEIKYLSWDLESIRDDNMLKILPDVKPNGNLKDPKKIAIDIATKKKKQLSDMGLNPMMNLICCFAWATEGASGHILLKEDSYVGEKKLLLEAWDVLGEYDHFVTFNGRNFDMRCMLLHGITHGICPSVNIDHGRYNRGNHTDLRLILSGQDKYAPGKLELYCQKYLGRGKTEGIDGKSVQDFWDNDLHEDVGIYGEEDAVLTHELFLKVKLAGLLE